MLYEPTNVTRKADSVIVVQKDREVHVVVVVMHTGEGQDLPLFQLVHFALHDPPEDLLVMLGQALDPRADGKRAVAPAAEVRLRVVQMPHPYEGEDPVAGDLLEEPLPPFLGCYIIPRFEEVRAVEADRYVRRRPGGVDQAAELFHRPADRISLSRRVFQKKGHPPGKPAKCAKSRSNPPFPRLLRVVPGRTGVHDEIRDAEHRRARRLVLQRVEGAGPHRLLGGSEVDQVGAMDGDRPDARAGALFAEGPGFLLPEGLSHPPGVLLGEDLQDVRPDPHTPAPGGGEPPRHRDVRSEARGLRRPGGGRYPRSNRWHWRQVFLRSGCSLVIGNSFPSSWQGKDSMSA